MSVILASKRTTDLRTLGHRVLARCLSQCHPSSLRIASPTICAVPAQCPGAKGRQTPWTTERETHRTPAGKDRFSLVSGSSKPANETLGFSPSTSQIPAIQRALEDERSLSFQAEAKVQRSTSQIHAVHPADQRSCPCQGSTNQIYTSQKQSPLTRSSPLQRSTDQSFIALLQTWSANQTGAFGQQIRGLSSQTARSVLKENESSTEKSVLPFLDNFDDVAAALSSKTNWELTRAVFVLWICSFRYVADHSLKMMSVSRRLLGQRLSNLVLKKTFYGQFVAGETETEIRESVSRLREANVGLLLAAPMEDDINSNSLNADKQFDDNLAVILNSMVLAHELDPQYPMIQLKLTAIMPGDLCALISERYPEPSNSPDVIDSLAAALQGQPLDIDRTFGEGLSDVMKHHIRQGVRRLAEVCKLAVSKQVISMVDAEYTYLNPALNLFSLAMMLACNDPKQRLPVIFYTYQNYLQTTRMTLERDMQFIVDARGKGFAAKLVRGAYMYKERQLADQTGRPDPIQPTYDATSAAYDAAVTSVLSQVAARPRGSFRVIVASHNEKSILSAVKGLQELNIDPQGGSVFFGQVMGMADHISYNLGINGFLARKSLPYGPVAETLPYLSRRAQENHSLLVGAGPRRERAMLRAELGHRFKSRT